MKVLYSIFSKHGSAGGHFFSFDHTITALSEKVEPIILYIGVEHSVIEKIPCKKYRVKASLSSKGEVNRIVNTERPDVIHCFDDKSYSYMSFFLAFSKLKFLLTIPGGNPDPSKLPYCKDIVLFSRETVKSFTLCKQYRKSVLTYIPNRVNISRLNKYETIKDDNLKLFQVIRIASEKHQQICKTLNLLKLLVEKKVRVKLILAGVVKSQSEKDFILGYILSNKLDKHFEFINDERVYRGSDLLSLGDCVIATGRSVMEAASIGKLILVPTKTMDYPVVLDKQNFEELLYYNFSGRTTANYSDSEFKKIELLLSDRKYQNDIAEYLSNISKCYFEITNDIKEKYYKIYSQLDITPQRTLILKNLFYWIKWIFRNIRGMGLLQFIIGK